MGRTSWSSKALRAEISRKGAIKSLLSVLETCDNFSIVLGKLMLMRQQVGPELGGDLVRVGYLSRVSGRSISEFDHELSDS